MASISKPRGTNSPHEHCHPPGRASVRGVVQNGHIRSPKGAGLMRYDYRQRAGMSTRNADEAIGVIA